MLVGKSASKPNATCLHTNSPNSKQKSQRRISAIPIIQTLVKESRFVVLVSWKNQRRQIYNRKLYRNCNDNLGWWWYDKDLPKLQILKRIIEESQVIWEHRVCCKYYSQAPRISTALTEIFWIWCRNISLHLMPKWRYFTFAFFTIFANWCR